MTSYHSFRAARAGWAVGTNHAGTLAKGEVMNISSKRILLLGAILAVSFSMVLRATPARGEEAKTPVKLSSSVIKQAQEKLEDEGHYRGEVDGLMGPQTRTALRAYQKAEGLTPNGRLTRETAEHLGIASKTEGEVSPGEHFEEAGEEVGEHYGKAGKEAGKGAKDFGKGISEGEVTEAGKDLGKGMGKFGKQVGKGTAEGAKEVAEGVKDVFDGDENDRNQKAKAEAPQYDVQEAQNVLKEKGYYDGAVDGLVGPQTREALKRYQKDNNLSVTGKLDRQTAEKLGID